MEALLIFREIFFIALDIVSVDFLTFGEDALLFGFVSVKLAFTLVKLLPFLSNKLCGSLGIALALNVERIHLVEVLQVGRDALCLLCESLVLLKQLLALLFLEFCLLLVDAFLLLV